MGKITPDGPRISLNGLELQAAPLKDPFIGLIHGFIAFLRTLIILIKGIGVFHDELAGPHDPEARPYLVAELGLDLVQVEREFLVGMDVVPHDLGDYLLMGGPNDELRALAVRNPQEFFAVQGPPAAFLPYFRGLDGREQDLLSACSVHLFADDLLYLLECLQPVGQV